MFFGGSAAVKGIGSPTPNLWFLHTKNDGKYWKDPAFFIGKLTISIAMLNYQRVTMEK